MKRRVQYADSKISDILENFKQKLEENIDKLPSIANRDKFIVKMKLIDY